ncbi:MAG: hypothetical protein AVDCRST_MAG61-3373, partial [uncultured Friedmanniella sp.]
WHGGGRGWRSGRGCANPRLRKLRGFPRFCFAPCCADSCFRISTRRSRPFSNRSGSNSTTAGPWNARSRRCGAVRGSGCVKRSTGLWPTASRGRSRPTATAPPPTGGRPRRGTSPRRSRAPPASPA